MNVTVKLQAIFILGIGFLLGCNTAEKKPEESSPTKVTVEKKSDLNPNGDSELALLMRAMYDEAELIGKQLKNEEQVTINLDYEKILSAHATEPEKAKSPEYLAFAKAFLSNIDSLKVYEGEQAKVFYKNMVSNCMSCHQALCPGPVMRIKKLNKIKL